MLLLDTHAYYWFVADDERLPQTAKTQIEMEKEVFVSIVSFWEMAIKASLGKLTLPQPIQIMLDDAVQRGFNLLPSGGAHLEKLSLLPWIHRDPFDRLLICQAQAEGLTLVSADENIRKYDVKTLWKD